MKYSQLVGFFSTMKTINEQIDPKIVNQARKLAKITRFLHNIIPIECRNHVQVANIRQQILMLITDSPVWTTRLRQLSPQILQYIRENSSKFDACFDEKHPVKEHVIHHIQISTRYNDNDTLKSQTIVKEKHHKIEISKKTAELLSQSANTIDYQPLKTALLKLASHGASDNHSPDSTNPSKTKE